MKRRDEILLKQFWRKSQLTHIYLLYPSQQDKNGLQVTASTFVIKADLVLDQEQILIMLKVKHDLNQKFHTWNQTLLKTFFLKQDSKVQKEGHGMLLFQF